MSIYNNSLLARHPFLQPLASGSKVARPSFELWTDASNKGYGAHLGSADLPIALYQQERMPSTILPAIGRRRSTKRLNPITLASRYPAAHEAAALFLSLAHWKPLLKGAVVVAHTDNTTISAAFGRNGTRVTVGREDTLKVVKAVKEWAKWRNVLLKVKLVKARDNRLADALSRLAPSNHPAYTSEIKTLVMDGEEARQEGETMIKKITAASLVHKYAQDEETRSPSIRRNRKLYQSKRAPAIQPPGSLWMRSSRPPETRCMCHQ
jgi:hypothetical protein